MFRRSLQTVSVAVRHWMCHWRNYRHHLWRRRQWLSETLTPPEVRHIWRGHWATLPLCQCVCMGKYGANLPHPSGHIVRVRVHVCAIGAKG